MIDAREMLTTQQVSAVREQWLQADACLRNPGLWAPSARRPSWVPPVIPTPAFRRSPYADLWLPVYRCTYAYTVSTSGGSVNTTSAVSGTADASTSTFVVVGLASYSASTEPTISDSHADTFTPLTAYNHATLPRVRMFYCVNPTVTANFEISASSGATASYPSVGYLAFTGQATTPFDQENGATGSSVTSLQTGSVTPSEDNELLVTTIAGQSATGQAINSSFTKVTEVGFAGGVHWSLAMGYKIQTTAGAENPTWSSLTSGAYAASIATFKSAAAAAGHPTMRRWGGVKYLGGQGIGQKGSGGGRMWGRQRQEAA